MSLCEKLVSEELCGSIELISNAIAHLTMIIFYTKFRLLHSLRTKASCAYELQYTIPPRLDLYPFRRLAISIKPSLLLHNGKLAPHSKPAPVDRKSWRLDYSVSPVCKCRSPPRRIRRRTPLQELR